MKYLFRFLEWAVIALLGVIVVAVIAEVFLRGLLSVSIVIHEELTRYLMIWVAMLGSVLLTREGGHISIRILPELLDARPAAIVLGLSDLIVIFFLAVFSYASATNLPNIVGQETITLGVGMVWFHAALPVGGILMLSIAVANLIRHFRQAMQPAG